MPISITLVALLATTVTSKSHDFPCIRALRSTPCRGERHGIGKGEERGRKRRWERRGKAGRGRNRTGNGERGVRLKQGGQQGPESKRRPLVEDVSEYWESYEGEGAK